MDPNTLLWIAVLVAWHPDSSPIEGSGIYPFIKLEDCNKKREEYSARTALTVEKCKRIRLDRYMSIMRSGVIFEDDD